MSDSYAVKIEFNTYNPMLVTQGISMLQKYLEYETNTNNILQVLPQLTSLLKDAQQSFDSDLVLLQNHEFELLKNKLKLLSSYPEVKNFFKIVEGDKQEDLVLLLENFKKTLSSTEKSPLALVTSYVEFSSVLSTALNNNQWDNIKVSWNKHCDMFDTEKITFSQLDALFPTTPSNFLSTQAKASYVKIIKIAQEKIAETLWNQFLLYPENAENLSKYVPDFFQFINWLDKSNNTAKYFVNLLEQQHWNNLQHAAKVEGFDFFLEKIFLNPPEDRLKHFDPFSNDPQDYSYINLNTIEIFNQKNINVDVVLKDNSLGLKKHLRDYLYQQIEILEKSGDKYSQTDFAKLDKLLIVYEKQKLESIYLPKNIKTKTNKI